MTGAGVRDSLAELIDRTREPILLLDASGIIHYANPAAHRLAACPAGSLLGQPLSAMLVESEPDDLARWLAVQGAVGTSRVRDRDGRTVDVEFSASELSAHAGKRLIGVVLRDVTEQKRRELEREETIDQLQQLAMADPLTGLPNRRAFAEIVSHHEAAAKRKGRTLTVAIADLDRFKRINDTYGHDAGDEVLRHAARLFRAELREADLVGRIGGEEFCIVLPETDIATARGVLDRVRRRFADTAALLPNGATLPVTISIGIAAMPPDGSVEPVLIAADRALYTAKRAGRNRIHAQDESASGQGANASFR